MSTVHVSILRALELLPPYIIYLVDGVQCFNIGQDIINLRKCFCHVTLNISSIFYLQNFGALSPKFRASIKLLNSLSKLFFQQQIKVLTRLYHRKLLISYTAFTWNLLCPFLPQTHALFIFLASDINGNLLNVNNKQYTFTSHIFGSDRSSNSHNLCLSGSKWSSFISHAQNFFFKISVSRSNSSSVLSSL